MSIAQPKKINFNHIPAKFDDFLGSFVEYSFKIKYLVTCTYKEILNKFHSLLTSLRKIISLLLKIYFFFINFKIIKEKCLIHIIKLNIIINWFLLFMCNRN